MNAAKRAAQLCDKLAAKGYPFMGAEVLLEIGTFRAWPLVQVWDDVLQSLIVIAVADQDRQLVDALEYARAAANQDAFGGITICYALGDHAWVSEWDDEGFGIATVMKEAL